MVIKLELADCVNSHCPNSGKPVSADGLMHYKSKVVGFCNPDCRDTFKNVILTFEASLVKQRKSRGKNADLFSEMLWEVAFEALAQDTPIYDYVLEKRMSEVLGADLSFKSFPHDKLYKADWENGKVYLSCSIGEERCDIIVLEGNSKSLVSIAKQRERDFVDIGHEDLMKYRSEIELSPKRGIVIRFRLLSGSALH